MWGIGSMLCEERRYISTDTEEPVMRYLWGFDFQAVPSVVVTDAAGRTLYQQRLHNDRLMILSTTNPCRSVGQIIDLESTVSWYWLAEGYRVNRRRSGCPGLWFVSMDEGWSLDLAK